jgi:hypothetical protein
LQLDRDMQCIGADSEVPHKPVPSLRLLGLSGVALDAEQVGWMDGDKHVDAARRGKDFTANLGKGDGSAQHATRRGDAKGYDEIGPYEGSLLIEPPPATINLVGVRALVQPAFATHLEFEVLDRVGDEDPDLVKAGLSDRAVEDAASRSNKGATAQIFVIAGLLPDEHDASIERSLSGNDLSGMLIERAARTVRFCAAKLVKG